MKKMQNKKLRTSGEKEQKNRNCLDQGAESKKENKGLFFFLKKNLFSFLERRE